MRKHSTHFLIFAYTAHPFGDTNDFDEKRFAAVQAELKRRGVISTSMQGARWYFDHLSDRELMGLEADLRDLHIRLVVFRDNLDQHIAEKQ